MSDNKKSNDSIDSFSEYFRQRLIKKPTPPDANCWDEIEARLPKRRAISPVWIGLAVAASIIVAVFILNNTVTKDGDSVYDEALVLSESFVEEEISGDDTLSEEDGAEVVLENVNEDMIAEVKPEKDADSIHKNSEELRKSISEDEKSEVGKTEEYTKEAESVKDIAESIESAEESREDDFSAQKHFDESQYQDFENLLARDADLSAYDENVKAYGADQKYSSKKDRRWLMLAGLGSAGSLGYLFSSLDGHNTYHDFLDANPAPDENSLTDPGHEPDSEIGDNNSAEKQEREITDINTSVPVSFGMTVRKKINKTIGIETGLLYTYLSSDLKISGADYDGATLDLHYIGIPVNLIVNMMDKKRWSLYASGGGMVDKGLQSVCKKNGAGGKKRSHISGLQWSLNGGIGISYNLYNNMNLYVEPSVSYYFDCNQPISRRTEDPFNFNLRLGFRYDI